MSQRNFGPFSHHLKTSFRQKAEQSRAGQGKAGGRSAEFQERQWWRASKVGRYDRQRHSCGAERLLFVFFARFAGLQGESQNAEYFPCVRVSVHGGRAIWLAQEEEIFIILNPSRLVCGL